MHQSAGTPWFPFLILLASSKLTVARVSELLIIARDVTQTPCQFFTNVHIIMSQQLDQRPNSSAFDHRIRSGSRCDMRTSAMERDLLPSVVTFVIIGSILTIYESLGNNSWCSFHCIRYAFCPISCWCHLALPCKKDLVAPLMIAAKVRLCFERAPFDFSPFGSDSVETLEEASEAMS
jgi:hypothetical protein